MNSGAVSVPFAHIMASHFDGQSHSRASNEDQEALSIDVDSATLDRTRNSVKWRLGKLKW